MKYLFKGVIKRKDVLRAIDKELERLYELLTAKMNPGTTGQVWKRIIIFQDTLNEISRKSAGLDH